VIWLTTRQNRFNALWMALALAAVAVAVLGAARWLASSVADPALRHCLEESAAGAPTTPYCNSAVAGFSNNFRWLDRAIYATMLALPAVVGCLVAVPMISREFEDGTYRLCWTQSVTRVNWFVSKVAAAVGVAVVAGGTAGVAAMVWAASAGPLGSFAWPRFDMYPPALVGRFWASLSPGAASFRTEVDCASSSRGYAGCLAGGQALGPGACLSATERRPGHAGELRR
jgi:hypothetical protein